MIIPSAPQFDVCLLCSGACLAKCLNSVLYVKVVVAAFNQEKALVGAFTVIVKTDCETDGSSEALFIWAHNGPDQDIMSANTHFM